MSQQTTATAWSQGLSASEFRTQMAVLCDEATVNAAFATFSTAHSWYKHTVFPEEMYILPMVRSDAVSWTAAPKRHLKTVESLVTASVLDAIRANPIAINALVFGGAPDSDEANGIHLTQSKGGDKWVEWLRASGYAAEADHVAHSNQHDRDLRDDDPVVVYLRRTEYARMLAEFKVKLAAIQAACSL